MTKLIQVGEKIGSDLKRTEIEEEVMNFEVVIGAIGSSGFAFSVKARTENGEKAHQCMGFMLFRRLDDERVRTEGDAGTSWSLFSSTGAEERET